MWKRIGLVLGVLALATPAFAGDATVGGHRDVMAGDQSTYVPGRAGREGEVAPYSQRGSAVREGPFARRLGRGGGPGEVRPAPLPRARGRYRGEAISDNQTRRPGATNYTGPSFRSGQTREQWAPRPAPPGSMGGGPRSQHTLPGSPGVSMVGDDFTSRTGSRTTGRIPVRMPSSNESAMRTEAPPARGGGPQPARRDRKRMYDANTVITPDGTVEHLAPSGPISWGVVPGAPPERLTGPLPLTESDLAYLPRPDEPEAFRRPGALATIPPVRSDDMLDTAAMMGARPVELHLRTPLPVTTRGLTGTFAVGGGPPSVEQEPLALNSAERAAWQRFLQQLAQGWPEPGAR